MSIFVGMPTKFFCDSSIISNIFNNTCIHKYIVIRMLNHWVKDFRDMSLPLVFRCCFSFCIFPLTSIMFFNVDGYNNKIIYIIIQPLSKRALSQHQFGTKFCVLEQLAAEAKVCLSLEFLSNFPCCHEYS